MTRNIALIGSGLIGKTHATVLRALIDGGLIDARLHAACDLDVQRAASMQDIFGFTRGTTILDEALDGADVVYVCTPTDAHASIVEAACARGQALFCEKPLAHTAPDAQYMADAVHKAGVPAQVGLVLRYSPIFGEMRAMINGAEPVTDPGRKMAAVFRDDQCFPVGGGYGSQWRGSRAIAGGGTLIEHSIHDVDLLRWMLGDVQNVTARTAHFAGRDVEDVAAVTFDFVSGAKATLLSVWHQMSKRDSIRHLEIFCERAWVKSSKDFIGPLDVQWGDGDPFTLGQDEVLQRHFDRLAVPESARPILANAYFHESYAFFNALQTGQAPSPSLDEAVKAHALVDAMYASAS